MGCQDTAEDASKLSESFEECYRFIKDGMETGTGVLVHCFAGKSRSATIVISYLMREQGSDTSKCRPFFPTAVG